MSFADLLEDLKNHHTGVVGPLVNRFLQERNHAAGVEPYVHPSSMPPMEDLCLRQLFLSLYTPEKIYPKKLLLREHSAKTHRIFDNGTSIHRRWQAYFIEMGICDPRVYEGWEISILDEALVLKGHADAVIYPAAYKQNIVRLQRAGLANGEVPLTTPLGGFAYKVYDPVAKEWIDWKTDLWFAQNEPKTRKRWWRPYGKPYLVDFKSIYENGYRALAAPYPQHERQVTAYAGWLRENLYPDLVQWLIIYENKNTQMVREFEGTLDLNRWSAMRSNLSAVKEHKDRQTLPERICKSGICERARHCDFAKVCFAAKSYKHLMKGELIQLETVKKPAAPAKKKSGYPQSLKPQSARRR
jgi:hypothetical protein